MLKPDILLPKLSKLFKLQPYYGFEGAFGNILVKKSTKYLISY